MQFVKLEDFKEYQNEVEERLKKLEDAQFAPAPEPEEFHENTEE